MRMTIIMSETPVGTTVNVRTDGTPANVAQRIYYHAFKEKITEAIQHATEALKASGVVKDFSIATGEEARLRGEARNGIPGEAGKN